METRDILDSWNSGDGSVAHYGIQRGSQVPLYVNTYQHGDEVETGSPNVKITKVSER